MGGGARRAAAQWHGLIADAFDTLTAAGHQHDQIMRYTWAQFRGYLRRARRRQAEQQLLHFISTNGAMNGGEGAKQLLKSLNEQLKATEADLEGA